MSKLGKWSTTAASNNFATPDGWPEGQAPSTVNDCAREMMASIRTVFQDVQFVDQDYTPTFISATKFSVPSDVTTVVHPGRRLKMFDATVSGAAVLYGTVSEASLSVGTTNVTLVLDTGALTASLSSFAVSILSRTGPALPEGLVINASSMAVATTLAVSGATVLASTLTVSGATSLLSTLSVSGAAALRNTTITGTLTATGATNLLSTLSVGGATKLGTTLSVSGATALNATLTVGGAVSLLSTLSVSGNTIARLFRSELTSVVNVPPAAFTNIYTFPNVAEVRTNLVLVTIGAVADASNYGSVAIIVTDNGTSRLAFKNEGTNLQLSLSAMSVSAFQNSGVTQTVQVSRTTIGGTL